MRYWVHQELPSCLWKAGMCVCWITHFLVASRDKDLKSQWEIEEAWQVYSWLVIWLYAWKYVIDLFILSSRWSWRCVLNYVVLLHVLNRLCVIVLTRQALTQARVVVKRFNCSPHRIMAYSVSFQRLWGLIWQTRTSSWLWNVCLKGPAESLQLPQRITTSKTPE